MALDGVFMWVDVNDNFFENDVVCTMLLLKMGGNICFSKYPAMCKCGLKECVFSALVNGSAHPESVHTWMGGASTYTV